MTIMNALMMSASGAGSNCPALEGTMWSWGDGTNWLGHASATSVDYSNPTQIGSATNWTNTGTGAWFLGTAGGSHHMINAAGELWAWGYNSHGALGLGDSGGPTHRSVPEQVGSDTDWAKVTDGCAGTSCYCIKTDGTLWAWGAGTHGRLGHNSTTSYSSPVQVGSLTDWACVVASGDGNTAHALKTDGTMWGWGHNTNGKIGDGTTTHRSSPVQVGTATDWIAIESGHMMTRALASV